MLVWKSLDRRQLRPICRLGNEEMESSMPRLEETTAVKSDGIEK